MNFSEQTNTLLYKNISHTLFSKGWCCCVWEMSWRQGQTAILTPSYSSTIAAFLFHLAWVAQPWVTEGCKALSLQAGSHAGILSPTDSNHPGYLVILLSHAHLLLLFFRLFTQVDLLINGSVECQYITPVLLLPYSWMDNRWIIVFFKGISMKWNGNSLVQKLNLGCQPPCRLELENTPTAPFQWDKDSF